MFDGEVFSGLTVSAATAAGRSAGSVARLALSLSLGAASSSSFSFFSDDGSSVFERLEESSESLLHADSRLLVEDVEEDDDLGRQSSSFTTTMLDSSSVSFGLDSRVRLDLEAACRSRKLFATCTANISGVIFCCRYVT